MRNEKDKIMDRVDKCWSNHNLTEYIIGYLDRHAILNGYRSPGTIDVVEIYIDRQVKTSIVPALKRILGDPDINNLTEIPRIRTSPYKGNPTASVSDPSYHRIVKVVECVFADGVSPQLGRDGQRLRPFFRRRTKSVQRALVGLLAELINYDEAV